MLLGFTLGFIVLLWHVHYETVCFNPICDSQGCQSISMTLNGENGFNKLKFMEDALKQIKFGFNGLVDKARETLRSDAKYLKK